MAYSTKVQNINIPWLKAVMDADPDFQAAKRSELAYDFSRPGRYFYVDPTTSGAYAQSNLLNDTGGLLLQEDGSPLRVDAP